jgi:predicted permease
MGFLRRSFSRFVNAVRPDGAESELAREVASHLSLLEDELQRRGLTPEEARLAARRAFGGGVEQAKERHRDARSFRWIDDARRDVRYAVRMLRRTPGFAAVAVATLALGIGANTAIFSLADAVLLRTLPVTDPGKLAALDVITARGEQHNFSYPLFGRLRDDPGGFSGVFAALDGINHMDMTGPEAPSGPEPVTVQLVSGEYFSVLGADVIAGRRLVPDDDSTGAPRPAAVLSFHFWMRRFAADPAVIGRTVILKNQPFAVVGVTRPGFFGESVGRAPDIWVPLTWQPRFDGGRSLLDRPNVGWLRVMGRLRPGMTRDRAAVAMAVSLARVKTDPGEVGRFARGLATIRVSDGSQGLPGFRERFSLPLRILAGVVGVVLLIACANVSCLLLARATARRREVAIRLCIGAGRRRLIRQFLAESALLAGLGGVLGLLVAWWGSRVLLVLASSDAAPIPIDVTPNLRTLVFTMALSMTAVLLCGLAPALSASRVDVGTSLKQAAVGRVRTTLSSTLVVMQVALSLLLVMGAVLMVQTLRNLRARDVGFAADAVVQVRIVPEVSGYTPQQIPDLSRRLTDRLSGIPGVESVTMAQSGFAGGMSRTCCIAVEGHTVEPGELREVRTLGVAPGYFRAIGVSLLRGRDFRGQDVTDQASRVAIVNEAFERKYFGNESPIGRRFGWGDPPRLSYDIEIIGVTGNAFYSDLREQPQPLIYFPTASARFLMIQATGNPQGLVATLRREIAMFDPKLEFGIRPVSEEIERMLVRERMLAKLSSFFGALAALLAGLGIYGLMAYTVAARTREIGIRIAIGARRLAVLRNELGSAMRLVVAGLAVGLPASFAAGRLIEHQLFDVSATEPAVLVFGAALLALIGAAAALVPARRASRVDPMVALRDQ